MSEQVGITYVTGGIPVYEAEDGLPVFVADGPYVLSDGKSLVDPWPVTDVGGPTWEGEDGRLVASIPITEIAP